MPAVMKQEGGSRRGLLPPGSRRAKVAWIAWLAIRKMREGPGPWLRAVRRGLFDTLPESWKARIAKRRLGFREKERLKRAALSGQEAFERRGRISVVLPVYRQADLLEESIRSVLAQTHRDLELLVVDDGSEDDIDPVLARFVEDPRVRVLVQPNLKLPHALSNGFEFARGEYRTWTSADNLMEPEQCARLRAFLAEHPETGMVYADYLVIDAEGRPLKGSDFRPQNRRSPDSAEVRPPRDCAALNLLQDNFIGPCFLYRGWIGRCLGAYAAKLGVEDYDYWMRVNAGFGISHLGEDLLLYRYRWHDNSLNARARELRLFEAGRELMARERARARFRARPWKVRDEEGLLGGSPQAPGGREDSPGEDGGKLLEVLDPTGHPEGPPTGGEGRMFACFWPEDEEAPFEGTAWFDRGDCRHFTRHPGAAASLALFTNEALFVEGDARALVETCCDEAALRAEEERDEPPRPLPRVWRPEGRRERVLFQAEAFVQGGLERVVLDLAEALAPEGFDAEILVLGPAGADAERARRQGLPVHVRPRMNGREYAAFLDERGVDLVHAHHSPFGADRARELGRPFVQTLHNTYVWLRPDEIEAFRRADEATSALICVSARVAQYAFAGLGLPRDRMLVVENGVRPPEARDRKAGSELRARLGFGDGDFVFLNVASLYPPKAQRPLLRAFASARREAPLRLVLLGRTMDDRYERELRGDLADLGLEGEVVIAGYAEDPAPFYEAADAFVLPSFWEGCSLAAEEALGRGLPAVLSDVGAAREQARRGAVALVPPPFGRITELHYAKLKPLLEGAHEEWIPDLARALLEIHGRHAGEGEEARRERGARAARAFDIGTVAARHAQIYRWLLQGGEAAAARPWTRGDIVAREDLPRGIGGALPAGGRAR